MRIILGQSNQEAVNIVSSLILEKVASQPSLVIGLATGKTMEPVYREVVNKAQEQNIDFSAATFFVLDEYIGLDDSHPSSFTNYVRSRLIHPLKLDEKKFFFPPVHLISENAGEFYEGQLKKVGPIDLQLLGIGVNGHIGFNEPGSPKSSLTRVVKLSPETLEANRSHFKEGHMPAKALSMGIGSILAAKEIVLLATGKSKADAIKYLFNHHDDESCPATFLKSHPHFTLVLDPEAASKISLKI